MTHTHTLSLLVGEPIKVKRESGGWNHGGSLIAVVGRTALIKPARHGKTEEVPVERVFPWMSKLSEATRLKLAAIKSEPLQVKKEKSVTVTDAGTQVPTPKPIASPPIAPQPPRPPDPPLPPPAPSPAPVGSLAELIDKLKKCDSDVADAQALIGQAQEEKQRTLVAIAQLRDQAAALLSSFSQEPGTKSGLAGLKLDGLVYSEKVALLVVEHPPGTVFTTEWFTKQQHVFSKPLASSVFTTLVSSGVLQRPAGSKRATFEAGPRAKEVAEGAKSKLTVA